MATNKNILAVRRTAAVRAATVFALAAACVALTLAPFGMQSNQSAEGAAAQAPRDDAPAKSNEVRPLTRESRASVITAQPDGVAAGGTLRARPIPEHANFAQRHELAHTGRTTKRDESGAAESPRLAPSQDRSDWELITEQGSATSAALGGPTFSVSTYDSQDQSYITYMVAETIGGGGHASVGDDYTTACDAPFTLEQFVFVGGVANAGEIAFFGFYDSSGTLVDGISGQFPAGGTWIWTLTLNTPFSIPGSGRVIMTTDVGVVGTWLSADQVVLGSNNAGSMLVDGGVSIGHLSPDPDIMAFELRGSMGTPTAGSAIALMPGDDGWTTGDGTATYDFAAEPIPADFFGPGSDPFDGEVSLTGAPFVTDPADPDGVLFAVTDTIVRRWDCTSDMFVGDMATVDIEIVALSLESVEPITVTYNGGQDPEEWDVRACLSTAAPQCLGTMTIERTHTLGGTFESNFPVIPKFTFDRQTPTAASAQLDLGEGLTDCSAPPLIMENPINEPNSWTLIGETGGPTRAEFGITSWPAGVVYDADCSASVWDAGSPTNRVSSGVSNFQGGLDSSALLRGGGGAVKCRPTKEGEKRFANNFRAGSHKSYISSDADANDNDVPDVCEGECCMTDGSCEVKDEDACSDAGGTYSGNDTKCDPTGACCLPDGTCLQNTTKKCCELAGGEYMGDGSTSCPVPPCEDDPPDPHATWSDGKTLFSFLVLGDSAEAPSLPADFFGPGSDPFDGFVALEGDPIDPATQGDTSTLIQRHGAPVRPEDPVGAEGAVSIEIVALSLVSVEPIIITYNGGQNPEQWDVRVTLSEIPAPPGQITATKTHANGGTFDLQLLVQPALIFTNPGNGEQRVLDTFFEGLQPLELQAAGVPFVHSSDPSLNILAPSNGSFVPGVIETNPGDPTSQEVRPLTGLNPLIPLAHIVGPARLLGACCLPDGTCVLGMTQTACEAIVGAQYMGDNSTSCPVPPCVKPDPDPHGTVGELSSVDFGAGGSNPPIPADFFGPGADPFVGIVELKGVPIDPSLGDASTLVQRSAAPVAPEDPVGTQGTIDIEIVALSLSSVEPITVTFNGGQNPELWFLDVTISESGVCVGGPNHGLPCDTDADCAGFTCNQPPVGELTATKTHANGGVFTAVLPVQAKFIFTLLDNPLDVRVLDSAAEGIDPVQLQAAGVPFVHSKDPSLAILAPSDGSFVPGVEETVPGDPSSQEERPMDAADPDAPVRHVVRPARLLGACCLPDGSCANGFDEASCLAVGGDYKGGGSTCAGDGNGNGIDDLCEGSTPGPLNNVPGPLGNRYIRVTAPGPGNLEILRVTFIALDGYGPIPAPFLYVGQPYPAPDEDTSKPLLTFTVAPLECEDSAHNWSAQGTIAIYGAEIMPGSEYQVQRADSSCPDLADPACWSAPITVLTAKYGDVWALYDALGNPPQPDFNDIAAVVRKFQASGNKCGGGANAGLACVSDADCPGGICVATAPRKYVCQLQPNVVVPMRAIDFKDIAETVDAFTSTPYAAKHHGPCPCPSTVTCYTTPCANDLACGTGLCVNGFCGDNCGRCTLP